MAKTPEIYRDIKIAKMNIRVSNGKKVPQIVVRLQCEVEGQTLQGRSWRDLELQIDEQLDRSKLAQSAK